MAGLGCGNNGEETTAMREARALELMHTAADVGKHGPAMVRLAVLYESAPKGGVAKRDLKESRRYWMEAVKADMREAHCKVPLPPSLPLSLFSSPRSPRHLTSIRN